MRRRAPDIGTAETFADRKSPCAGADLWSWASNSAPARRAAAAADSETKAHTAARSDYGCEIGEERSPDD